MLTRISAGVVAHPGFLTFYNYNPLLLLLYYIV